MTVAEDTYSLNQISYEPLLYYSTKFQKIRVDRSYGIAPHKPILLLSVIQLIEYQKLKNNRIYLQKDLFERFQENWRYLGSQKHNPDAFRPFFHLRGDRFWHHIHNPGFRKIIASKIKLSTLAEVQKVIKYAYVDDALFELLQNPISRNSLTSILVNKWFRNKQDLYNELVHDLRID